MVVPTDESISMQVWRTEFEDAERQARFEVDFGHRLVQFVTTVAAATATVCAALISAFARPQMEGAGSIESPLEFPFPVRLIVGLLLSLACAVPILSIACLARCRRRYVEAMRRIGAVRKLWRAHLPLEKLGDRLDLWGFHPSGRVPGETAFHREGSTTSWATLYLNLLACLALSCLVLWIVAWIAPDYAEHSTEVAILLGTIFFSMALLVGHTMERELTGYEGGREESLEHATRKIVRAHGLSTRQWVLAIIILGTIICAIGLACAW